MKNPPLSFCPTHTCHSFLGKAGVPTPQDLAGNTLFGGVTEGRQETAPWPEAEGGRQDFSRQSHKPQHQISSQALISAM